ncbi:plasmid maintenance system killer (plasmid) [Bacillus safensis]|uniref:Plasmid maintenance system killer n=1 Tax=Bacillus safensis TaxID=561879 RepID=A0A1L6ZPF7_BACIA|nr:type II toxin-antitoxin system RelE/ParE family toxin [Bacillus safensis]APT48406.1 plasmid maintenance system killer [Bacillus safensis]
MIRTFRSKALSRLWNDGDASKVRPDQVERVKLRLSALQAARRPDDMNIPGFRFHQLQGKPQRYAVAVNGPWRVTFGWDGEDATEVDLEQYH